LDHDSSVNTFCISRMAGVHHHTCGWDGDLNNFLPQVVSNHNSPDLCFQSSWHYVPGKMNVEVGRNIAKSGTLIHARRERERKKN
jgi:hypothetical protein